MSEEEQGFVIRDKRGRSAPEEPTPSSTEPSEKPESLASAPSSESHPPGPPLTFASFVFSLGTSALMLMGETLDPQQPSPPVNLPQAKEIIDNYFEKFPGFTKYMADTKVFARDHGYVETIMGRRRYLRDINSKNWTVRAQAERNAINSPIQGSAADLIKVAMINIQNDLKQKKFATKMLLQVHDELVFEVPKSELVTVSPLIEEGMKNAIPNLKVPVVVDIGVGNNWLEAH